MSASVYPTFRCVFFFFPSYLYLAADDCRRRFCLYTSSSPFALKNEKMVSVVSCDVPHTQDISLHLCRAERHPAHRPGMCYRGAGSPYQWRRWSGYKFVFGTCYPERESIPGTTLINFYTSSNLTVEGQWSTLPRVIHSIYYI